MKYENPMFCVIELEDVDVITLSVNNDIDPEIKGENGNPWAQ